MSPANKFYFDGNLDDTLLYSLDGVDRKAKKLWIDGYANDFGMLQEFSALESLSIYRLPKKNGHILSHFELLNLKKLCIRDMDASDLSVIMGFSNLEELTVWQSKSITSLRGVERFFKLINLIIKRLRSIDSLAPISQLRNLKHLEITGDIRSSQFIKTLKPLSSLVNIEVLDLSHVKIQDNDLSPLTELPKLRELGISARNFPIEQIAGVAAAHPFWLAELLELQDFDDWEGAAGCKKCGGRRKLLFIRGKKGLRCPKCEKDILASLLKQFKDLVEQKRANVSQ